MSGNDNAFWIELLSRQNDVLARYRVRCDGAGEEVRVGRGYDNDVIVDDPFVAARHLRIVREETGALVAEDLGSANGLYAGEDRRRVARAVLDGQRPIRIGRTRLRVRQAGDAVAPERIVRARLRLWPLVVALALAVLGGEALSMWLRETTEQKLGDYLGPLVALCAGVALWTAAWAVLSRIFSGRARFERHVLIALSGLLVLWLVNELAGYAAFSLSRREFSAYRYIAQWLVAAWVCFLHLRQLSQSREAGRARLRLQAAVVATLALVAAGMQTLSQWETSQSSDQKSFVRGLKPPMLNLAGSQTGETFFAEVTTLKSILDRARTEAPARIWAGDDDD